MIFYPIYWTSAALCLFSFVISTPLRYNYQNSCVAFFYTQLYTNTCAELILCVLMRILMCLFGWFGIMYMHNMCIDV